MWNPVSRLPVEGHRVAMVVQVSIARLASESTDRLDGRLRRVNNQSSLEGKARQGKARQLALPGLASSFGTATRPPPHPVPTIVAES